MTYQLCPDYVPVLSICLEVCVLHELVVLEHSDPIALKLPLLLGVTAARLKLLDGHRVCIEILENYVVEEGNL